MQSEETIELLPGEEICPKCDGVGETLPPDKDDHYGVRMCDRCWGDGKLDWIEMAMGKPIRPRYGSSSSSSMSSSIETTKREGVKYESKWLHSRRFRNIGNDFRQLHVRQKRPLERQLYQGRGR